MALKRLDSFEITGTGTSGGRTGKYLDLGSNSIQYTVPDPASLLVGVARKAGGSATELIYLFDSASNLQLTLLESGGYYSLYRGDSTTGTLLGTSSPQITMGIWIYLELKVTIDNTNGAYELRINEVPYLTGSGKDTQVSANASVRTVSINGRLTNGGGVSNLIDDLYIADIAPPMPAGDFYGNLKIECRFPNGAGAHTEWTPSAGENYDCVNETGAHNSDTDYVYSPTVSAMDTYAVEDMVASSGYIRAAQLSYVARKDEALAHSVAPVLRSGGTDYPGSPQLLTTSYVTYIVPYDEDPYTSAAWDFAGVNDVQIGQMVIS